MSGLERIAVAALGLLLGAQAVGKLFDVKLYVVALERFRAFPKSVTPAVALVWIGLELVALAGLGTSAVRPTRAFLLAGSVAASIDALAYAALTIGTSLRGIEVFNCTCFGAFLPQRLSASVLVQDLVMVAWTLWALRAALRFQPG